MAREAKREVQEAKIESLSVWEIQWVLNNVKMGTDLLGTKIARIFNSRDVQSPQEISSLIEEIGKILSDLCLDLDFLLSIEKHQYIEIYWEHAAVISMLDGVEQNLAAIKQKNPEIFNKKCQTSSQELISSIHLICSGYENVVGKVEKLKGNQLVGVSLSEIRTTTSDFFSFVTQTVNAKERSRPYGTRSAFLVDKYEKDIKKLPKNVETLAELLRDQYTHAQRTQALLTRINPEVTTFLLTSGSDTVKEVGNLLHAAICYVTALKARGADGNLELLQAICMAIVTVETFLYFHEVQGLEPDLRKKLEGLSEYVQYLFIVRGVSGFDTMRLCLDVLRKNPIPQVFQSVSFSLVEEIKAIASVHSTLLGESVLEDEFQVNGRRSIHLVRKYREASAKSIPTIEELERLLWGEYETAESIQELRKRVRPTRITGFRANGSNTAPEVENFLDSAVKYTRGVKRNRSIGKVRLLPAIYMAIVVADKFMHVHQEGKNPRLVGQLPELSDFATELINKNNTNNTRESLVIYEACLEIVGRCKSQDLRDRLAQPLREAIRPKSGTMLPFFDELTTTAQQATSSSSQTPTPSLTLAGSS